MTADPTPWAIRARWVLPVARPPIDGGVVVVRGERIVAVAGDARDAPSPIIDLGDAAVIPGLVNAHTHLELSGNAEPTGTPGMPFAQWIRLIVSRRRAAPDAQTPLRLAAARTAGLAEAVRHGTTLLADIASAAGYRPAAGGDADVLAFAELIGFKPDRASAALELARASVAPDRGFAGLSPHAPYTIGLELLAKLSSLAGQRQTPLAMHVAESPEELELLAAASGPLVEALQSLDAWDPGVVPRGTRPLDYLRTLSAAPRSLVVHGNYLSHDERRWLAEHRDRMTLVYCPRTHAYFGHAPYPLAELLAEGVAMALGTDSRASSPDLSLLAELRHVAARHRSISPQTILEMGTIAGARAVGQDGECGTLEAGKRADLAVVRLAEIPTASDPHEALLAAERAVSATLFRGRWTHRDEEFALP